MEDSAAVFVILYFDYQSYRNNKLRNKHMFPLYSNIQFFMIITFSFLSLENNKDTFYIEEFHGWVKRMLRGSCLKENQIQVYRV